MRPRVFPAEDPRGTAGHMRPSSAFNEAAGIPRGRPWRQLDKEATLYLLQ